MHNFFLVIDKSTQILRSHTLVSDLSIKVVAAHLTRRSSYYLFVMSRRLVCLALLAFGVMMTLMLVSYVPEDPSWLSATDEPAKNYLGRFGASLASPLCLMA